uniref:Uncharacterized protein n=1 Tax=Fusarium oxysporum (strain Fo5176) TaxID=660025 RepID=A0A0D2Y5A2_FUSOF
MSRLRQKVLPVLAASSLPSSHITSAPDISWTRVGPGKDHILSELESLYWDGVKAELENIVRTLKAWQQPEFADVAIEDEDDDLIHGFDTFLDSVSQQSRAHAIRYDRITQQASDQIKSDVRGFIEASTKLEGMEHRAWILLQAAGFLDMEKLIEHRPPPDMFGFWKRPAIPQQGHTGYGSNIKDKCKLLQLGDAIAMAKYLGLQSSVGAKPRSQKDIEKSNWKARVEEQQKTRYTWSYGYTSSTKGDVSDFEDEEEPKTRNESGPRGGRLKRMKTVQETSLHANDRSPTSTSVSVAEEAAEDGDIPLFFRKYVEKYPYGNVHMALRVGPIVIENGVAHTKGGALVSLREMPIFHERFHLQTMPGRDLAVGGGLDRPVWKRKRKATDRKRYKAIMKQVVGVPFSGDYASHDQELSIVQDLLAACKQPFDDPGLPTSDQIKLLDKVLEPALEKLKTLLSPRLRIYLGSISERLLDQDVKLAWSATHNNCQTFCSSLIDKTIFQPLVNGEPGDRSADVSRLYTMSFVCPDEGYKRRGVRTKFDVPFGLTEEYLLRFHFGRHDESDIIDTYQEYWYDWGAFGSTLYKYQDLYPWDCTEAYGRYPTKCGDCNLAKHVWAFPFDSWSISSHHLSRDRHMYAPALTDQDLTAVGKGATATSWMRNRLTVLSAMSVLHRAATAMAQSVKLQKATAWLHKDLTQSTLDPSLARVKLGGIHRAQPCSHYYEAGVYSHFFIAPWATLTRAKQIEAYELQRDGRVGLPDMPAYLRKRRFSGHADLTQYNYVDFGGTNPAPDIDIINLSPHHHIGMDNVDGCYSDSHFSPTSEKPCHVCASGCGSSTRNAADCASGETIRMAEAATAAALAAESILDLIYTSYQ